MESGRSYRIDALKGIAIIAVVLYHFGGGYLTYGYLGVDIFFVVSGYFMMKSIAKAMFAFITMVLYAIRLYAQIMERIAINSSMSWAEVMIDGFPVWFYIISGIGMTAVMVFAFIKLSVGPSYQEFLERFFQAREREENEWKNKGMNKES